MFQTLKLKLITTCFVTIVLSIASVSAVVFVGISKYSRSSFETTSATQLQLIDAYITEFIRQSMNDASYLAALENSRTSCGHLNKFFGPDSVTMILPESMSFLERELFKTFKLIAQSHPAYEAVFLGSKQGGFVQYPVSVMPEGYDPRNRPWYKMALTSPRDSVLSKAYMSASGSAVSTIMARVRDSSGSVVGVIGLDVNLDTLTSLASRLKLGRTGYIMLLENDGTILSDPAHKELNFKKVQETKSPCLKALAEKDTGTFESQINGEDKLISVRTSQSTGWKLVYIIDSTEVFEISNTMLIAVLLIGTVLGTVLLIGAWFLTRALVRPLNLMTTSAEAISKGDFNALPKDELFNGDFLTVHLSLKKMVKNLLKSIDTAEAKERNAKKQSQQAQEAMREAEQAMTQAKSARKDMARTAKALEEVIKQVASASSQQFSDQAENASQAAGTQNDRTARLKAAIKQLGSVTKATRDASNTEEVVADEVRKLAEKTIAATREMKNTITEIQMVDKGNCQ